MNADAGRIVLASRSPRRLDLLSLLVPMSRIDVQPPRSSSEPGFKGLTTLPAIEERVRETAIGKCRAVSREYDGRWQALVAADTVIVGDDDSGIPVVLGQPPQQAGWEIVVREWFERYYFGRTHLAITAVVVASGTGIVERVVTTRVGFSRERANWLDWYLSTGEPRGKAGGYALQGLASLFVEKVEGSLSNVVGLPLAETRELLQAAGVVPSINGRVD
jgi:septum formation protein